MTRSKKDSLTGETAVNSDLNSDISKGNSTKHRPASTPSKKKAKGDKQGVVLSVKKQKGLTITTTSSEKCGVQIPKKQSVTHLDNVLKKPKKHENDHLSTARKSTGTASGVPSGKPRVSKSCDTSSTEKNQTRMNQSAKNVPKKLKKREHIDLSDSRKIHGTTTVQHGTFSERCDKSTPALGKPNKSRQFISADKVSKKSEKRENLCHSGSKNLHDTPSGKPPGNVSNTGDNLESGKHSLPDLSKDQVSEKLEKCVDSATGKVPIKVMASKKTEIKLRPSNIRYSQGSISSLFKDGTNIGQLLDDIFFGRCFVSALPQIEVSLIKGQWVSADNRRLWVFKQLEKLGRVDHIIAKVTKKIYGGKLTSETKGLDIEIRNGKPKGVVYSLMYPDTIESADEPPTEEADSASETKRKRSRRRRKRKTKISENDSSNLVQNNEGQKQDLIGSDILSRSSTNEPQHCHELDLELLLQYNRNLLDENTCFEIYTYSDDDDDWIDGEHVNDTAFSEDNDFSEVESLSEWLERERENVPHADDVIAYPTSAYSKLQMQTMPAFMTDTDDSGLTNTYSSDFFSSERRFYNSISPIQAREYPKNKDDSSSTYTAKSLQMSYDYNYEMSDSDVDFDDFDRIGFCQKTETGCYDDQYVHPDVCGSFEYQHWTYKALESDVYLGQRYNAQHNLTIASPVTRTSQHSESTEFLASKVKNQPENTFLSKLADGIEAVAGFLNKLFK